MSAHTILITGAADGLGRALAERLACDGADLVLHGRRPDALADIAHTIAVTSGRQPRTVLADFADLDQVRAMATEVCDSIANLDVLVNNAGVGAAQPDSTTRSTTPGGVELRFGVNYLASALLSLELLPRLRRNVPARIVNVASIGQHPLEFEDLMLENSYSGTRAYAQSKLAMIMFGFELADRLPADAVTVNSLHPATYMPTKMVLNSIGHSIDSLETGVAATHRLITDPSLDGITGRFYDRQREARANDQAYDPAVRAQLWATTLRLLQTDGAGVGERPTASQPKSR
jgi:NAD(P)-dependent dehydrogenase (short-subunit alcohol dehydrogenase family)